MADDDVPCADTHSQHQECTPPQCVQTDCGKHEAQSSIHSAAKSCDNQNICPQNLSPYIKMKYLVSVM